MNQKTMEGENKKVEVVNYTEEEKKHRDALITKLNQMRDDRDSPHNELDGMTYVQYYESNRKKDLSFIPPKRNKQDVRVVTGTTREKDTTLLSTLTNMDLEPDVSAFDQDDLLLNELGDNMSDLVKKSRNLEDWDKKRPIIYREMISQGDVFVEELYVEEYAKVPLGDLKWNPTKDKASKMSFKEKLQLVDAKAKCRMLNGKKVYLGDLKVEYAEDQDIIAVAEVIPRARAEAIYGQWDRWENVPYTITHTTDVGVEEGTTYKDWNLISNDQNQVVVIRIYDQRANRFMIMLNGVMMMPINYPLTAISPTGKIPISQGKLEPISGFAYSKSQPSKTKVDQEVIDELTKLMIEKTRQSFKPPMGNTSKKVYSSNIFLAGKMTSDIGKNQLFPLFDARGVTTSEFSFYNLMRESINEKTTNDTFGGSDTEGDPTATEINRQQQQQMQKLGHALDGVVNLERSMTWNRIQTILRRWTLPMEKNLDALREGVYKTVTVDTTLPDGQNGLKMFKFTTDGFPPIDEHEQEEEDMSKVYNKPVRIMYMNPIALRHLKAVWYIMINPTQKSNDKMSQLLFVQNIQQAQSIFGVEALNYEYLKQRYATLLNEDYTKMFKKMDLQQMVQQDLQGQGGAQQPQAKVSPANADGKKPMRAMVA